MVLLPPPPFLSFLPLASFFSLWITDLSAIVLRASIRVTISNPGRWDEVDSTRSPEIPANQARMHDWSGRWHRDFRELRIKRLIFIFHECGRFCLLADSVLRRIIAFVFGAFRQDERTCIIVGKDSRLSVFPSRTPSSCLSVSVLINHDNPCLSQTPERIRETNWAKLITRSLRFASQLLATTSASCSPESDFYDAGRDIHQCVCVMIGEIIRTFEKKVIRYASRCKFQATASAIRGKHTPFIGAGKGVDVPSRGASNERAVMQPFKFHPSSRIYDRACSSDDSPRYYPRAGVRAGKLRVRRPLASRFPR